MATTQPDADTDDDKVMHMDTEKIKEVQNAGETADVILLANKKTNLQEIKALQKHCEELERKGDDNAYEIPE